MSKKQLKMAIEIVDFPIKHGGSFHSFLYVYQRVNFHFPMVFLWFSYGKVEKSSMLPSGCSWNIPCCVKKGDFLLPTAAGRRASTSVAGFSTGKHPMFKAISNRKKK
jgi:hypothetical protein